MRRTPTIALRKTNAVKPKHHHLSKFFIWNRNSVRTMPLQKIHMNSHMWFHVKSCENMWNYVILCDISHVKGFHMKSHVKFHKWKDFTWNHMWHFTCERISHEITCDISHVEGFHMKSHVTFDMWKDFTWNHMWHFTCGRISHEITREISHVKWF